MLFDEVDYIHTAFMHIFQVEFVSVKDLHVFNEYFYEGSRHNEL